MQILFVNACVRKASRTRRLAEAVLKSLPGTVSEVAPMAAAAPIREEVFLEKRSQDSAAGNFSDPAYGLARQFAQADVIVIAAPYWDLSFPAALKAYLEQINVVGLTFEYTDAGIPRGLCRAKRLIYVTTAGGPILSDAYGSGYIRALAQTFYGIEDVQQVKAEMLDVVGADEERILTAAVREWQERCEASGQ